MAHLPLVPRPQVPLGIPHVSLTAGQTAALLAALGRYVPRVWTPFELEHWLGNRKIVLVAGKDGTTRALGQHSDTHYRTLFSADPKTGKITWHVGPVGWTSQDPPSTSTLPAGF